MIIFGTKGVTTTPDRGTFVCPTCGPGNSYAHKRVRRFFTLYFIPVIPLDHLGEYIECARCQGTYHLDVLNFDPETQALEFETVFRIAARRIMVAMMAADGVIDDDEIKTIQEIYREITQMDITADQLHDEVEAVRAINMDVRRILVEMKGMLNDKGKEIIFKAAFSVAMADGEFQVEEQEMMAVISEELELTPAHVNGLMAEVQAGPAPPPPLPPQTG